ncbi:geopeptide radical SAM maturase [Geobacter sp. DSM 9736]|uniref:geopeptide radical SAM maturase n=1 Tax=Geobacter sp. DSM 9736 TaxID=1277350 RepID=UPI000B50EF66|nr:geopeptide radical SAM maturase [Geobacter sp. DSM 9736]SNB48100.1 uncharacterized protein SAMN06269301_3596 [Geobacter sp. DSM 9736]
MPLSRYVKIWPCPDRPGCIILYSTRKGSVVRIPESRLDDITSGNAGEAETAALQRVGILVEDRDRERQEMETLMEQTNSRSRMFRAKVALNLDCNLACPYCFEGNFRKKQYMSEETAGLLVEHVRNHLRKGGDVRLGFYGGEPLLSIPLITEISTRLLEEAGQTGSSYTFSLTTNGTLLTRKVVEKLLPLGLTGAIVTLDGPRHIHDRQRPFVSGKGSFDVIVTNIAEVANLTEVQIGGNFTEENYREFPTMLDVLKERGIGPEKLGFVEFAPIMPKTGGLVGTDSGHGCISSSEPWVAEAALFLREETLKRGFAVKKTTMSACVVEMENDLVVNWDGALYKCPGFMGWPEMSVGTLAQGVGDYRESHNLDLWKREECLDCAYLPLCFGGCRLITLMSHGAIDRVDCRKALLDKTLREIVLQDMRYRKRSPEKREP